MYSGKNRTTCPTRAAPVPLERLDYRPGVLEVARQRFLDDDVPAFAGDLEREIPVVRGREADVHQLHVLRRDKVLIGSVRVRPDNGCPGGGGLGPGVGYANDLRLGHVGVSVQVYGADKEAGADDADPHPASPPLPGQLVQPLQAFAHLLDPLPWTEAARAWGGAPPPRAPSSSLRERDRR